MKYFLATLFLLCAGIFLFGAKNANASIVLRSFGGKITSTQLADVDCYAGTGPVTQKSAGTSPTGSYFYPYGKTTSPTSGSWVLGLYNLFPDVEDCETESDPPIPYTTFRVSLYGVSKL